MGKVEKERRPFMEPTEFYRNIVFYMFFGAIAIFAEYLAFVMTEDEMIEFINRTDGNSEDRLARSFVRFFMMIFGNVTGFRIGMSIFCGVILLEISNDISAYFRYRRKCKLYHEGVIKNINDIYDDGPSISLIRLIKRLFTKRDKRYAKRYPSVRKMKKAIRNRERMPV
jgi:hypothetical protein